MNFTSNTNVIPMKNLSQPGRLLPFVAISVPGADLTDVLSLTPRVMRWDRVSSERIWIADLESCIGYWRAQAQLQGRDEISCIRSVLERTTGVAHQQKTMTAVMADHPWQAVLLLEHMQRRGLRGFVSLSTPIGQNLWREVSWSAWEVCVGDLSIHFDAGTAGLSEENMVSAVKRQVAFAKSLRRGCEQLLRAVPRLGMTMPWQMRGMDPLAIRRRFGAALHEVWTWAFAAPELREERSERDDSPARKVLDGDSGAGASSRGFLFALPEMSTSKAVDSPVVGTANPVVGTANPVSGFGAKFPWRGEKPATRPEISRYLEFPLCEWDHMQPLLKEDLDRLCALDSWHDSERVLSLEWRLVLSDMTILEIPVRFRHPHHLHAESGHQRTALLQALYSFQASLPGSAMDPSRHADMLPTIPVTAWHLAVAERLLIPRQARDLFGSSAGLALQASVDACAGDGSVDENREWRWNLQNAKLQELLHLENRLPVRLESWDLSPDWHPEDSARQVLPASFADGSAQKSSALKPSAFQRFDDSRSDAEASLTAVARGRPLFVYRQPYALPKDGRARLWRFCERTMDKWWRQGSPRALQRDYYVVTDDQERKLWVYKDSLGRVQIHGVFA